jgi:hypothetical protein
MAERGINFLTAVNSSSNIQIYVLDQQISLLQGYGPCLAAVIPRTRVISMIYVVGLNQEIQGPSSAGSLLKMLLMFT